MLIVYPKIYKISFVKIQTIKIIQDLSKLFCVDTKTITILLQIEYKNKI